MTETVLRRKGKDGLTEMSNSPTSGTASSTLHSAHLVQNNHRIETIWHTIFFPALKIILPLISSNFHVTSNYASCIPLNDHPFHRVIVH